MRMKGKHKRAKINVVQREQEGMGVGSAFIKFAERRDPLLAGFWTGVSRVR